jgi:hypothetical protein
MIELASADPNPGAVFYTLDQKKSDRPQFERLIEGCLVATIRRQPAEARVHDANRPC